MTQTNPYELSQGYQNTHDFATTGVGLTIDSIKHWLYEHHLDCEPTKYNQNHYNPFNETDFDEINDTIKQCTHSNQIAYQIIKTFWAIPDQYNHALKQFIDEYSSYINI